MRFLWHLRADLRLRCRWGQDPRRPTTANCMAFSFCACMMPIARAKLARIPARCSVGSAAPGQGSAQAARRSADTLGGGYRLL